MRLFYILLVIIFLTGCKEMEYGGLTVSLKDGPAQYEEVNVEIESVEIYIEGIHNPGWFRLNTNKGVYNLLQFQSASVLLAQTSRIPAGRISQVRITFGKNNTLRADDQFYALRMPLQPGETKYTLLVPAGYALQGKSTLHLIIDIDAERSVVRKGKSEFMLEPVAISGTIGAPLEIF
jgi:hypothetical protein